MTNSMDKAIFLNLLFTNARRNFMQYIASENLFFVQRILSLIPITSHTNVVNNSPKFCTVNVSIYILHLSFVSINEVKISIINSFNKQSSDKS